MPSLKHRTSHFGKLCQQTLHFSEIAAGGDLRPPRGALEVAAWEQRARWLPELAPSGLCSEHYLLYTEHRAASRRRPLRPFPRAA